MLSCGVKIYIIIPVYNEGQRAVDTINKVIKNSQNQIVVVDDGSSDNSCKLLLRNFKNKKQVEVIRHIINLGKGAAMKTGAEMAWKMGADSIIFLDSDGQHDPKHLKNFEEELKKHSLVFGYRQMNNRMPLIRKWGNIFAKKLIGVLFNIDRKDLLCGYLAIKKDVYEKVLWKSPRYGIETEMATKVGKHRLEFSEVKVDTIYIDKYKGVSILDALKILFQIPLWYFEK